jgi:hypothetical protein
MNVLDNYKEDLLNLGDPYEIDDDTYFCKFNYNNMPFMVKTNKICVFKKIKKNKDNYVNISITSKDYLVWFETFYTWCVQTFHERSEDWFEEPLTLSDVEFSFINPLKSNIKDNCFDIQCSTDENRLHIVDTEDNVNSLDSLKDCNIIPTFHIKGVKFNNKHFSLDIEVNNILVILEDLDNETTQMPLNTVPHKVSNTEPILTQLTETNEITESTQSNETTESTKSTQSSESTQSTKSTQSSQSTDTQRQSTQSTQSSQSTDTQRQPTQYQSSETNLENVEINKNQDELNEVSIPTDDLEEMSMDIESNGFYEIYELLDEKIKDNIIQNLQKLFNKKKIKINMDLTDIFDEE